MDGLIYYSEWSSTVQEGSTSNGTCHQRVVNAAWFTGGDFARMGELTHSETK